MDSRKNTITFITWLWDGWRNVYNEKHVAALRNMLSEHAPDHRLIAVSDHPIEVKDVIYYPMWEHPIPDPTGLKANCFARLRLFDPIFSARFGSRLVSIDLDVLIQKDMRRMFRGSPDFRAVRGESAIFNGSMYELRQGAFPEVWRTFAQNPTGAVDTLIRAKECGLKVNGSDQGWLSLKIDHSLAQVWDESDGVFHWSQNKYSDRRGRLPDAAMICFAGGVKPWDSECRRITPQIHKRYMEYYNA